MGEKKKVIVWIPSFLSILLLFSAFGPEITSGMSQDSGNLVNSRDGNRIVMVEIYSSVNCSYCYVTDHALDDLLADYGIDKMFFTSFHMWFRDPYDTPEGLSRASGYYSVQGTPTVWNDGVVSSGYYGSYQATYNALKSAVDTRLAVSSPVELTLDSVLVEDRIEVNVGVTKVSTVNLLNYYIRTIVMEDGLVGGGDEGIPTNTVWNKVVRDMSEVKITDDFSGKQDFQTTLQYKTNWKKENLWVVAFVQRGKYNNPDGSKEVLNCRATNDLSPKLPPSLTLTYPTTPVTIKGRTNITWNAVDGTGSKSSIRVDLLYRNDTTLWTLLLDNAQNTGVYEWDTIPFGDDIYWIKVNISDPWGRFLEKETAPITVDNPDPPWVVLTNPLPGMKFTDNITITWDAGDDEDQRSDLRLDILYSYNGVTFEVVSLDIPDSGSYLWDVKGLKDSTSYTIKVKISDTTGLFTEITMGGTFTIDLNDSPLITIETRFIEPEYSGSIDVEYSVEDDEDPVSNLKVSADISMVGTSTWTNLFKNESSKGTFTMDTTKVKDGDHILRMTVYDISGLFSTATTQSPFTIYNNDPPVIRTISPQSGGTFDEKITFEFIVTDQEDDQSLLKVTIEYSDDMLYWAEVGQVTSSPWDLDIGSYFEGTKYFRLKVIDTRGLEVWSSPINVEIYHNQAPRLNIIGPSPGERSEDFNITWSAIDPDNDILKTTISYSLCKDGMCTLYIPLASDIEDTGRYWVRSNDLQRGKYRFKVTVKEPNGRETSAETGEIILVNKTLKPIFTDDDDDDDLNNSDNNSSPGSTDDKVSETVIIAGILFIAILVAIGTIGLAMLTRSKRSISPPLQPQYINRSLPVIQQRPYLPGPSNKPPV